MLADTHFVGPMPGDGDSYASYYGRFAITAAIYVSQANYGQFLDCNGTFALTLRPHSEFLPNFFVDVFNSGSGTVTLTASNADAIVSPGASGSTLALTQGQGCRLIPTPTGWDAAGGAGGGGGGVTSVGLADGSSTPTFTISGSPVTTTGTLTFSWTNQLNYTFLAAAGTGSPVGSSAPRFRTIVAADLPAIDLTSGVTNTLPVANGGTGASSFTAYGIVHAGATSTSSLASLVTGMSGQVLTSNGAGAYPTWQTPAGGSGPARLFQDFADASTSGTGETDLYTHTLGAGQLANNGDTLICFYSGSMPASQTLKWYFGGNAVVTCTPTLSGFFIGTPSFKATVTVVRDSSTSIRVTWDLTISPDAISGVGAVNTQYATQGSLTLSATNVVKISGTASSGTITASMSTIDYWPKT